jgi:nitroreductase
MDAITCLKTRRSIRSYTSQPVPDEVVLETIDCARLAPTAMNAQPWTFVVVRDTDTRRRIVETLGHAAFLTEAPVCVAVFCRESDCWVEDGSAAVENLLLAAHARGLGACWVAGYRQGYARTVASLLGAPPEQQLLALVSLGFPNEAPSPEKRPLDEVVRRERF